VTVSCLTSFPISQPISIDLNPENLKALSTTSPTLQVKSSKMPAGPDETDNHVAGGPTESVAQNASSKTESTASTHPMHNQGPPKGEKVQLIDADAHKSKGPAIPDEFSAKEEGTKEERRSKAEALNK
jgi:hypothetical protein